ncbi:MAG: S8 family serine peptidase [Cyanobacteria bacterium P01_D01_bin.1]
MIKRLLPLVLLMTGGFWGATSLSTSIKINLAASAQTNAQTNAEAAEEGEPEGLYYTFFDQRILVDERPDQVAVQFVEDPDTREGLSQSEPNYRRLEKELQTALEGTRDIIQGAARIEVSPLGNQYALVTLPENGTRSLAVTQALSQSYIATTLPVLTRSGGDDSIVVTPEIVVSFAPETTAEAAAAMVSDYGIEVVRPLRFSPGRYLVRATEATGTAVLSVANQLETVTGIQSATPNFVQSVPYRTRPDELQLPPDASDREDILEGLSDDSAEELPEALAALESSAEQQDSESRSASTDARAFSFPNTLLPLQWYLNSLPRRPAANKRTDIYALEAWLKSDSGEGVTVAVIDSLIQWDHPDLISSVYRVPANTADLLPGEVSGWDFSGSVETCEVASPNNCAYGDPDTRISAEELSLVRTDFQNTIALSDSQLLATYAGFDNNLKYQKPEWTDAQRADFIRYVIQGEISSQFHGTWSAGVIAARPQQPVGMVGVSPNAQFLPVRVFGLGGSLTNSALIEAAGYAAARGVDVINMSLGGPMPDEEFQAQLADIRRADPDLVIVASAGNANVNVSSFPAAGPGIVSVGSTNLDGYRAPYSSYGANLDVVAPGGDVREGLIDGILTAGGTWVSGFWEGLEQRSELESGDPALDKRGFYVGVQGTSFAAPAISGIVALMKDADDRGQLTSGQIVEILQRSADHDELVLTSEEMADYQAFQAETGSLISAQEYFFGSGLVNAEVAVDGVRRAVE